MYEPCTNKMAVDLTEGNSSEDTRKRTEKKICVVQILLVVQPRTKSSKVRKIRCKSELNFTLFYFILSSFLNSLQKSFEVILVFETSFQIPSVLGPIPIYSTFPF